MSGASSGIGEAVAEEFLRRDHHVVGLSRRGSPALAENPAYLDLRADLRDGKAVREALRRIDGEVARGLRAVILNAGTSPPEQPLTEVPWSTAAEVYASNVGTALHLVQAAVPVLRENGGGALVFVGSSTANGFEPGRWPYAASKAAMTSLMRACSVEFAADGITSNEVRPGPVATQMITDGQGDGVDERFLPLLNAGYGTQWLKSARTAAGWIAALAELPSNGPTGQVFNYSRKVT
ncbi:SDR family oxidoreductase [Streptomyces sp. NPDC048172]|uniref:SDR family oxidoreductase n=1 Tax=Streptomyces sp. NPDC048172 TaxID=3365505 RepID=UPI00371BE480